jgi:hypothetical protein
LEAALIAKRFFYVSAGLCLLALTYHLGAKSATAQGSATTFGAMSEGCALVARGATLYGVHLNAYTGVDSPPTSIPLPQAGTLIAMQGQVSSNTPAQFASAFIVYEDGSLWFYSIGSGWQYVTSMIDGVPTATSSATWGRVKADYRK